MTQVEAGKLQMMPKITKPIELIEYAIKANQVQADKFGIQIEVEYPEEKMPKLFVDSEKIAWVLTNLLSNAIRYSKENGRVVIGAKHDEDFVEMYVQDFGKGIDPRYHQSIFDRYLHITIPYTAINVLLNAIPVYIGFRFIGKKFTLCSCLVIFLTGFLTDSLPAYTITSDILMISIFGGLINGFAISLCCLLYTSPSPRDTR